MANQRFTLLPKETLDTWIESTGMNKIPEEIAEILSEDVTYHIRELVYKSMQFMKHSRRSYLTVDDVNSALKESDTETIFGHNGVEAINFKAIPYKEGSKLCYLDEKDVNLRELSLDSVYPCETARTSVKASWLVLEGNLCGNIKDEIHLHLNEVSTNYLKNMTSALISNGKALRKLALEDLRTNKKLQIIIPHLVSFCSCQIKQHTGKETFSSIAQHIVSVIGAMVKNASVVLTSYLIQLAKILLFILTDVNLDVKYWHVKDNAAIVLSVLSRRHSNSSPDVHEQLLKSYMETLNGKEKPLGQIYGALSGIQQLGTKAILTRLCPTLSEKMNMFNCRIERNTGLNALEIITLQGKLSTVMSSLYRTLSTNHSKLFTYIPRKNTINFSHLYQQISDVVGESFAVRCTPSQTLWLNNTQINSNVNSTNNQTVDPSSTISENKNVEKIQELLIVRSMDVSLSEQDDVIQTNCSLGMITFTKKISNKRKWTTSNIFEHSQLRKYQPKVALNSRKYKGYHKSLSKKIILPKKCYTNAYIPMI